MNSYRRIKKTWKSRPTIERAGVHLKRALGNYQVPQLDPFLLLDDFRSDNPDHYLKGFPWHPHDPKKVILVPDPYSSNPFYYEFKGDDVIYAEKLPSVVNFEGETITMARLWVKKMSVGMLCTSFLVEETKT